VRSSTLFWIWLAQGIGGATPAITKLALDGLGPFSLVVARQVLGALFLAAIAAWSWRTRRVPDAPRAAWTARDVVLLLVLAWAGFALPQVLGALGLERSSATHGALLSPLEPIGILVGAALVLREPLGVVHYLAGALGVAGTIAIVLSGGGDPASGDLRGDVVMAIGHLCWAIYTLAAKPLVARHDPLLVSVLAAAISWIPLLPLALREPFDAARAAPALGWVLLLAFLASGLALYAWNRALREIGAATMALFVFVQPLVGLLLGLALLGESAGPFAILGATSIVLGVALATWRGDRAAG